jgi:replicative DNA helicase Mcm
MEFQGIGAINLEKNDINNKGLTSDEISERFREFINLNKSTIMKNINKRNVFIDITELRDEDMELYDSIINDPDFTIQTMSNIASNDLFYMKNVNIDNSIIPADERTDDKTDCSNDKIEVDGSVYVRFYNYPEMEEKFIRDIRSMDLNKLICTEALIRQVSGVKTIVDKIKFACPSCGSVITIHQSGDIVKEPNRCSCGRQSNFSQLSSVLNDVQLMSIEEKHEDIDNNHQPEKIKIVAKDGLTDKDHAINHIPGTVVKIIGTVKEELKYVRGNNVSRITEKFIDVNNIIYVQDSFAKLELSEEDENKIKDIASKDNTLEIFSKSMAPSVIGYDSIKKSLSLQVMGGVKNKRSDGSYTRENIHGLIVGDAGLSKSVMLKFISSLMPRGRYVSGRGASGVGITASVVRSELTSEYTLEGGALIMANGSLMAVDEAEKMKEEDITNLHEAMSIGTVTIDKANLHAVLPARTSVLMAANPKWGRFRKDVDIFSQIKFPPSLMSRFDFVYAIKDTPNEETDEMIANKILSEHMDEESSGILSQEFLQKYIYYARQFNPKLTKEANQTITKFYIDLRKQSKESGDGTLLIPITPRQLESLVRLSEAHARMKLHSSVCEEDALQAITIFKEYLIEFGYDDEAGAFNIDRIMGNSTSKMTIVDTIIKYMKRISSEYPDKSIPYNMIYDEFKEKVEEKKFEDAWYQLQKNGDILKIDGGWKLI